MQVDPSQRFAIVPKAFQPALFTIPDGLRCTQKRYSNDLILFGRVAIVTSTMNSGRCFRIRIPPRRQWLCGPGGFARAKHRAEVSAEFSS
jgi:hypothetical protein